MKKFIGIFCILTILMTGFYGLRPVRGEEEPGEMHTMDVDDGTETGEDDTQVADGSARDVSSKE